MKSVISSVTVLRAAVLVVASGLVGTGCAAGAGELDGAADDSQHDESAFIGYDALSCQIQTTWKSTTSFNQATQPSGSKDVVIKSVTTIMDPWVYDSPKDTKYRVKWEVVIKNIGNEAVPMYAVGAYVGDTMKIDQKAQDGVSLDDKSLTYDIKKTVVECGGTTITYNFSAGSNNRLDAGQEATLLITGFGWQAADLEDAVVPSTKFIVDPDCTMGEAKSNNTAQLSKQNACLK